MLTTLHTEMMKAVYPDFVAGATKLSTHGGSRSVAEQENGLMQPFFLRTQRLQKENNIMSYELKVFGDMQGFLASQEAQRDFAVNFTHKMALKKMQGHWFVRWKIITQAAVKFAR